MYDPRIALAFAALGNFGAHRVTYGEELQPIPAFVSDEDRAKQNHSKGLKEFIIDGKKVWAINKKNAIKKAKK